MGLRDRFQNLKESVSQWTEDISGNSPDKKIEKNLVEMESGSEIARTAAVKALVIQAQIDEKWLNPIINSFTRVLPKQPGTTQEAIIDGLMELRKHSPSKDKEIFEALQRTFDSPHPSVRSKVVEIWTRFSLKSNAKESDTISDLFEILSDEDKDVRYQTQESLIKILNTVPKAALPQLKKALSDDDWRVVYHSIVILTNFAKKHPGPSVALAPEVIKAFNSGERLKERAAECIGILGLSNPEAMKPAVPGLIKGIESKSSELRKASSKAIGRIGSKNAMVVYHAVPKLAKALKNDDWYIHVEVVKALGYIGSNKPALVKPHLEIIRNRTKTGAERNICQAAEWALKKAGG
ncbi:MAG: hypothetical protein CMA32_02260 [Euryarchaeota archaeon]|nr:hypothetical protein [Euryarchaeota archaeon]